MLIPSADASDKLLAQSCFYSWIPLLRCSNDLLLFPGISLSKHDHSPDVGALSQLIHAVTVPQEFVLIEVVHVKKLILLFNTIADEQQVIA